MPETQVVAALEKNKYYTHADLFYVNRHSFWSAGQDSWTLPPAQDQDAFIVLTNVEPVIQGILQRRRGYSLFSNQAPGIPYTLGYSYRNDAIGLREVVFTSVSSSGGSNVLVTTETGQTYIQSLFVPQPNAFRPRMVLSRDFGYFADGVASDYRKFDGTQNPNNLTNWGISIGFNTAGPADATSATDLGAGGTTQSQGPNNCTAGVNTGAGVAWGNPGNVAVSGQLAVVTFAAFQAGSSQQLQISGFGFNVPSNATITGILYTYGQASGPNSPFVSETTTAMKGGVAVGTPKSSSNSPTILGGSTDLWGTTWLPSDINSPNFGVLYQISTGGNSSGFNCTIGGVVQATVYYTVPSGQSWGNPNGSFANNPVSPASAQATVSASSDLRNIGFGFAVSPSNIVTGVQVNLSCRVSNGSVNLNPVLVKAGATTGLRKTVLVNSTSFNSVTFGGSTDLWGTTFTPADINSGTFGVQYNVSMASGSATFSIDRVQITVFTQNGPLVFTTNTNTTNVVLLNGRTYFYAFNNSKTGTTSTLSPPSLSTGPLTGNEVDLTGIPTSTDPQVDTVLLLATADGNDQTTLYLLGTVPNGTPTFQDKTVDTVLITQPLYLNTDSFGTIHGIANNNVPPLINFPIKHKGRIYGAVGRALFFSKNLDEVTTANGLVTSKWEEAWPATNQFDISEQAETIQALLSDGETLWIGTERAIRRLIGDSPANFQKPEVQFNETGVLNQDCWKVTFYEGQPVGTMWVTPDLRVMASDFNTYQDMGGPVQDVLNSINVSAAQTIHASFVSRGPSDYYMLYVPTGINTQPDTCLVFNLRTKKWFVWKPTDTTTASLFLIDASGNPRWLFASAAGPLYEWTFNTFQDRIGNTPLSYPVTIQTSWLDMGDYNIRKFVNQIIPTTADSLALTVQVDAASNELDFNTPLSVVPPTTVVPASIPTDVFVPLASGPSHSRAFRFTFVSPPSTIQNVLTGYAVEAGQFHRY